MADAILIPEAPTTMAEYPLPPTDLPFDNGENMDSPWHRANIELLIDSLECRWHDRKDFYTGGNMFVHFDEKRARNRDFRGPDFFVVLDTDHDKPRLTWTIWEEDGKYPDLILELLSPSTAREDLTTKKKVYERNFRLPEFLCYDPTTDRLQGWRYSGGKFVEIPIGPDGRIWSDVLGAFIGTWRGTYQGHEALWLRLFEADGSFILTGEEKQANLAIEEATRAEKEATRAEQEALRAHLEADRAQAEAVRADRESARARRAEEEAERLRKEMDSLRATLKPPNS